MQRALFDRHPGINNIGKPRHLESGETARFIETLRFSEHFSFRENRDAQSFFASQLEPAKLNVFSAEDMALGPYWINANPKTADRHSILLSLKLLGPNAKVLVVVRDQLPLLSSIYTQLLAGGNARLPDFQSWVTEQLDNRGGPSVLDALDYAPYLEVVADLFGREHVIAMDFTEIASDTEAALTKLTAALELEPLPPPPNSQHNVRRTGLEMRLLSVWKRAPWLRAGIHRLPEGLKRGLVRGASALGRNVPTEFTEEQKVTLQDHFAPHNARLRESWGLGEGWSA
ncbi:MAG: hypothetical protein AAF678_10285 [Pseudomonadota bacterium]